ncbi:hypothetical protein Cni_G13990 [Canna indica]|uniref:RRM domain-containing protein n=1 Tax=Canna indica TaxID=4628 RepID=A0AAQ3QDJ4_9LILI|nr:hypothetical protein Cni_G13990 [Canna indica]
MLMADLNPFAPPYFPASALVPACYAPRHVRFVHNFFPQTISPVLEPCLHSPPPPLSYCYLLGFPAPMPVQLAKAAHERVSWTLLTEDDKKASEATKECKVVTESSKADVAGRKRASVASRRKVFVPRGRSQRKRVAHARQVSDGSKEYEFKRDESGAVAVDSGKTTVMIRNLPIKFTKENLLSILDAHCKEENEKVNEKADEGEISSYTLSEFDFLYLPIDFRTRHNMGYAFANFTTAIAARRLYDSLHKHDWMPNGSRKVCEVTYAKIQGLAALQTHFKKSTFACDSDDFLPVFFVPPRNGLRQAKQQRIGIRLRPDWFPRK